MRAIVCGGRDFSLKWAVQAALDRIRSERGLAFVIEGGASGADALAREWARSRGVQYITVRANWLQYGRAAGAIRNTWMLERHRPEVVIAFPGGKGTADMTSKALNAGLPVISVEVQPETDSFIFHNLKR